MAGPSRSRATDPAPRSDPEGGSSSRSVRPSRAPARSWSSMATARRSRPGPCRWRRVEHTQDTGGCSVGSPPSPGRSAGRHDLRLQRARPADLCARSFTGDREGLAVRAGHVACHRQARPGQRSRKRGTARRRPSLPRGPAGTLVLSLEARSSGVGGSLVAVDADGRVRAGWPVELKRPGAEFWSVISGTDGTTFALAVEPEPSGKSSASVLAIAPDSTVLYCHDDRRPRSRRRRYAIDRRAADVSPWARRRS